MDDELAAFYSDVAEEIAGDTEAEPITPDPATAPPIDAVASTTQSVTVARNTLVYGSNIIVGQAMKQPEFYHTDIISNFLPLPTLILHPPRDYYHRLLRLETASRYCLNQCLIRLPRHICAYWLFPDAFILLLFLK